MGYRDGIKVSSMPSNVKAPAPRTWIGRTLGPMAHGSLRGSIFMFMSSAIGPGALLLPHMFRLVGLPGGLLVVIFGAFCVAQSLRFVITIAHLTGCDSYSAGVAAVLGPKAGSTICHITNFVLVLAIGSHLKFLTALLPGLLPEALATLLPAQLVAVLLVFPFCALPDLAPLRHIAMVSPLSLIYVIVLLISRGLTSSGHDSPMVPSGEAMDLLRFGDGGLWGLPQAWSILLNAVTCHHVAVPVYKQLHMARPQRINKVVLRATAYLCCLYGLVGVSGFLTHGEATPENILLVYPAGDSAALIAQALVGSNLLVAIPLNLHSVRNQVSEMLPGLGRVVKGSTPGRCLVTALLLFITVTISNLFPNVTSIIGIACGFGMCIYIFVTPACVMCALRWGKWGRSQMRPSRSGESLTELLLSSPLSSPLMSPDKHEKGMISPKLSDEMVKLDRAPGDEGFADELDLLLPEATLNADGSLVVAGDCSNPQTGTATMTPPRTSPQMPNRLPAARRDFAARPSPPHSGSCTQPFGSVSGSSSPAFSRAASEYTVRDAEWSAEFTIAVIALFVASGLGFASAGRTLVGLLTGEAA